MAVTTRASSSRHDRHTVEHASFFGRNSELYGCMHLPNGPIVGGVVITCSLEAEVLSNYRSEVLLARSLARKGVAVQRFHYRGSGHSEGDWNGLTLGSMQEDAREAIDHLIDRTSVENLGFFGARFGAIVAAAVGRTRSAAPVVVWEPVIDFARYMREVIRYQRAHESQIGRESENIEIEAMMERDGRYNSLGYDIGSALYRSALGSGLEDALGDEPTNLLLVQMGRGNEPRPPFVAPVERLRERGYRVDVDCFPGLPAWWLLRRPPDGIEAVIERSAEWLARALQEAAA